jgi:hypothetical protein
LFFNAPYIKDMDTLGLTHPLQGPYKAGVPTIFAPEGNEARDAYILIPRNQGNGEVKTGSFYDNARFPI